MEMSGPEHPHEQGALVSLLGFFSQQPRRESFGHGVAPRSLYNQSKRKRYFQGQEKWTPETGINAHFSASGTKWSRAVASCMYIYIFHG